MNTLQYLVESTYNFGHAIDQIYREIIEPIIIRMKNGEIVNLKDVDIKPYLEYLIDKYLKDWDVSILLSFRQSPKLQSQAMYDTPVEKIKQRRLDVVVNIPKKDIKTSSTKEIKNHIEESLTHELAHVIDKIRSKFKVKAIYSDINLYKYASNSMEFNAFINEVKRFSVKNKKLWNNVKSYDDLIEVLDKSIPVLSHIEKDNPNGYKILVKKLLKRMAREDMLPTDMINKYDAY